MISEWITFFQAFFSFYWSIVLKYWVFALLLLVIVNFQIVYITRCLEDRDPILSYNFPLYRFRYRCTNKWYSALKQARNGWKGVLEKLLLYTKWLLLDITVQLAGTLQAVVFMFVLWLMGDLLDLSVEEQPSLVWFLGLMFFAYVSINYYFKSEQTITLKSSKFSLIYLWVSRSNFHKELGEALRIFIDIGITAQPSKKTSIAEIFVQVRNCLVAMKILPAATGVKFSELIKDLKWLSGSTKSKAKQRLSQKNKKEPEKSMYRNIASYDESMAEYVADLDAEMKYVLAEQIRAGLQHTECPLKGKDTSNGHLFHVAEQLLWALDLLRDKDKFEKFLEDEERDEIARLAKSKRRKYLKQLKIDTGKMKIVPEEK